MNDGCARLITPAIEYKESFLRFVDELVHSDEPFLREAQSVTEGTFEEYLLKLRQMERGVDLPEGIVPMSTFWLVLEEDVVGVSHLRHRLNEVLSKHGGHVGFYIRRSYRGRGLARQLLALTAARAKRFNLDSILITCDSANLQSVRTIESCGALLEEELISPVSADLIRHYRLTTSLAT